VRHPGQPGADPGLGLALRSSASARSAIMDWKFTSPRSGSLYRPCLFIEKSEAETGVEASVRD
jgi:hypothetical protein